MSDPSGEIQVAQVAALRAADVASDRIYETVPEAPTFPYVTVGEGDTVGADNDCFAASEVTTTIHVWSRKDTFEECKAIGAAIRGAVSGQLTLATYRIVDGRFVIARWIRDPDGKTRHGILEFRYLVDHPTA